MSFCVLTHAIVRQAHVIGAALIACLGTMLVTSTHNLHAADDLIAPGATLQKLSGDFEFTEGPAVDAHGNIYFTDQPNDRILRWTVDGKLTTFLQPCGRSNGLYFDRDGQLLACADEKNQLWSIDALGKHKVLVDGYQGHRLNGPNDLWVDPQGAIYFTDPYYQRPYWKHTKSEQDQPAVYRLSADRRDLVRVADGFQQPNGIVGTPDGKQLYVADIGAKKTYVFAIADDGRLTDRRLFCESGSDGMTIDAEGNVYLTGKGVLIFDRDGKHRQTIAVPEGWTANACFGGADGKTLFITASHGFYSIAMRVRGGLVPPPSAP